MTDINNLNDVVRFVSDWASKHGLSIDCPPFGNFNSEIAIIGNHVHEGEKIQRIPFVRGLGEVLWNALRIEKINRNDVYQTIAIKKYKPSVDPKEDVKASKEEIDAYGSLLRWEISQLPNLKYIVVLGDAALKAFLDLPDVNKCQGSVYDYELQGRQYKIIVFINPDTVLRQSIHKFTLTNNCKKLTRVLKGEYSKPIINTLYDLPFKDVINYIRMLMREKKRTALDIENTNNETACIGLANRLDESLCINFRNEFGNTYTIEEELQIRSLLQHWFNRKDEWKPRLVTQNGMFDSYCLWYRDRLRLPPIEFDTMLASHTQQSMLPHGLDYLTARYTDIPYYKDQGKTWKEVKDYPQFWRYNGLDCCATLAVSYKQEEELRDIILPDHFNTYYNFRTMLDFFYQHVMRLQPHLIRMTVGGIKVDLSKKSTLSAELLHDLDLLKTKFYAQVAELTGEPDYKPNLASPKQMGELFFTKLRLVGRGTATDEDNRKRMFSHAKTSDKAREMLTTINTLAEEQKFFSTYVNMTLDEDGRARSEYKQTGVKNAPGRLSAAQLIWGAGTNFQNQPARAQEMYEIDEGYEGTYFDLGQAEARVVGWRFVIPKWIDDFERARLQGGYDAHRSLASDMWGIPYEETPTEDFDVDEKGNPTKPTIRYKAKRTRHGCNYTMGPDLLAQKNGFTLEVGKELHRLYHQVNPELQEGWSWSYKQIAKYNCMYNAYGRRYTNLGTLDPKDLGNIVAFYFQSTIGDKVSRCIYLCEEDPEWPKTARILLNIHDALVAIHKPEDRDVVLKIMKKHAEEVIHVECVDGKFRDLIIPADFKRTVPYTVKTINGNKIKIEDGIHRWSTFEKVK